MRSLFRSARASRPREGFLASLEGLSLRASLGAICLPLVVLGLWFVFERFFGGATGRGCDEPCGASGIPRPLFVAELTAFFLVPMLALAGVATATVAAVASAGRRGHLWLRDAFLIALGLWAVATAAYYVAVVVPQITA